MMLVQALRLHLREGTPTRVGWLAALANGQMSRALAAIHADPARRWALQDLAATAGMSRSTFALRFRETVGETPMDYIARWRMLLAADRLSNTDEPLTAIALSLGYESESAFSTAFKRVIGCSPREHCRRMGTAASDARSVRAAVRADPRG
ncbi:Exoenzyme S synthesis regulatory protein ExsA [Methylobrevis pamukkalensis]|uniref:Exoenzyme S synthesis regulatory protein ExsA n=1 Tax=Methylobrevis pamukkalensis TaxID=1439726 RepID=A0A1E3H5U3_9HYPH|nr:Exoenzyme S synthesis regulatory protein ExsA [Methylobrevis pamukkalensis]